MMVAQRYVLDAGPSLLGKGPWKGELPLPVPPATVFAGITKDGAGTPLDACAVELYDQATDMPVERTTSDGSGNYLFVRGLGQLFYARAYKVGSPDVAGTTLENLPAV